MHCIMLFWPDFKHGEFEKINFFNYIDLFRYFMHDIVSKQPENAPIERLLHGESLALADSRFAMTITLPEMWKACKDLEVNWNRNSDSYKRGGECVLPLPPPPRWKLEIMVDLSKNTISLAFAKTNNPWSALVTALISSRLMWRRSCGSHFPWSMSVSKYAHYR